MDFFTELVQARGVPMEAVLWCDLFWNMNLEPLDVKVDTLGYASPFECQSRNLGSKTLNVLYLGPVNYH